MKQARWKLSVKDIAQIGMMVAVIEVSKTVLLAFPNVELTSFWTIMFTLFFGWKILFVIPVFILLEGCMYGVGIWWVMYLYAWPLLAFLTWIFRKQEDATAWAILSGIFGLSFGMLCSIPYVVTGAVGASLRNGFYAGFTWWVAGIPWDLVHGVANFVIMRILYRPVRRVMEKVEIVS